MLPSTADPVGFIATPVYTKRSHRLGFAPSPPLVVRLPGCQNQTEETPLVDLMTANTKTSHSLRIPSLFPPSAGVFAFLPHAAETYDRFVYW